MNDEEIKIIGSIRAALIHQKFTSYMPIAMDEAIDKLTNLMRDHFELGTQHTNKTLKSDPKNSQCKCDLPESYHCCPLYEDGRCDGAA